MGQLSRRKGAKFERDVAAQLRTIWPEAKRGIGQARAGHEVADVTGCPVRIECKVGARPDILAAIRQARCDGAKAKDNRPVMVVSKRDHESALATVELDFMVRLLSFFRVDVMEIISHSHMEDHKCDTKITTK